MTTLEELSQGSPKVLIDTLAVVNQIHSLAASAGLTWHEYSPQAFLAALYQDDDAHDTCSLTACLNPLHPGPCKGWKGTLFDTAPGAWHSLEAAKVEKANAARVKKIEALKQAGKPIPHKLLTPIVAKPHPHAGQTANKATGDAHKAGLEVTENAGVKTNTPGKVSLGQAAKSLGPVEKGPKGKKPTLASKGIAFVISQPKVTDQYKLDKAAAITPEQWKALSEADQSTIRGELAKVKKDGFGPQQTKADELLSKLPAGAQLKTPTAVAQAQAANATDQKAQAETVAKAAPLSGILAKAKAEAPLGGKLGSPAPAEPATPKFKGAKDSHGVVSKAKPGGETTVATSAGLPTGYQITKDSMGWSLKHNGKLIRTTSGPDGKATLTDYAHKHHAKLSPPKITTMHDPNAPTTAGPLPKPSGKDVTPATPEQTKAIADLVAKHEATPAKVTKLSEVATPKTAVTTGGKPSIADMQAKIAKAAERSAEDQAKAKNRLGDTATPAAKPKPLPAHVEAAIAMAKGQAPGASWSKNHLAAYQSLSAEEFHGLPPDVQSKVVAELVKAQSKFLDPKKVQAAKDLLDKFGKGEGKKVAAPKLEHVDFGTHLHDHSVTSSQAKEAAAKASDADLFKVAQQAAGVADNENPDSMEHGKKAIAATHALEAMATQFYNDKVTGQPSVKAALADFHDAAAKEFHAENVHDAKTKAFNKISMELAHDHGELSPIQKAALERYQKYLTGHPVKTDAATMSQLAADTKAAQDKLDDKLHAALKQANAPSVDSMTNAQIEDRAKELLGPGAGKPDVNLTLADMQDANKVADAVVDKEAKGKYPPEVLSDPAVEAKYAALKSVHTQVLATKLMLQKLDTHIGDVHIDALTKGIDFHGDPLTADDKKVIAKHADLLKSKHASLDKSLATQEKKLPEAQTQFDIVANQVQAKLHPPAPATLSLFDQDTIKDAFSNAWAKHVNKAVTYGLKTYSQKEQIKNHPAYLGFTTDLTNLKDLAGKLAVAHAQAHTLEQNVPHDPDTGALVHGPEWYEWQKAVNEVADQTGHFNDIHKQAQAKLDTIRVAAGLKKRALPKLDTAAVKVSAAETGYYKSTGFGGPNYGKASSGKQYMVAKVGPKLGVAHLSSADKATAKLGAPAASTAKIKNATPSGEPIKLGGGGADSSIAHIPDDLKKTITNDFKNMPDGKYLADPAPDIFDNLVTLAAVHGTSGGLNVDQVLKTIDETHSKSLGVANSGMLHKKITDWLGTDAGKTYAESHSTPDPKVVKQLKGEIDLPDGVTLAPGQKVQTLAGPGPHDKSLDEKAFKPLTALDAQQAQDAWMKANGVKWSATQKASIKSYTGSTYSTYNGYLRGTGSGTPATKQAVINIQSAMMPLPQHTLLKRGTGWPPELASFQNDPKALMGKTFEDKAFVSTTVAGSSGHFSSQPLQLLIEAPEGTPAAFVNGISHFKGTENEMLLAAGTKFKVLSVDVDKFGHTRMRVRIVGDK